MRIDKAYIIEHDLINRYLLQRLNDDELSAFEIYLLEHPELLDEIEEFSRIKSAVQENRRLLKVKSSWYSANKLLPLAACLLLAIALVFNPLRQKADFPLQEPIRLESFRSAVESGSISGSGAAIVQLQIAVSPLDVIDVTQFRVEVIEQASGDILFSDTGLSPTEDAWLYFSFDGQSEALQGNFNVRVTPEANPAATRTYNLVLVSE